LNILFITANRLGDAVLSTGILGALIDRYPASRITVACGAMAASLFTPIPHVVRVIAMTKQPYHGHWRKLWRETVDTRWDLVVDLRNTLVSRLLRRTKLIVFHGPKPRQHMVEGLAALLDIEPSRAAPRIWLDALSIERVADDKPAGPLLAMAPGANTAGKRWPSERYAALARKLLSPDGLFADSTLVLLGSADERSVVQPILDAIPAERIIDLVGGTDPLLAAAWLTAADFYIGNDSGLTHLAAAAGAPTLALFGPGIPIRYRPWGVSAAYLIANDDPDRTVDLCKISHAAAVAEMEKLSVEDVCRAVEVLYKRVVEL
jgi:lipopolysaccharide export system permease protein